MQKYMFFIFFALVVFACKKDKDGGEMEEIRTQISADYNPTDYELNIPDGLPQMEIPLDNAMTNEGVQLGRHLFFDPIFSLDSTISCASCHLPELGFSDPDAVSLGVNDAMGTRNAMSLVNVGFYTKGLFWDGRVQTLEEQALLPVEDHLEMNEAWPNVLEKLARHEDYPAMFREAFGIEYADEITKELAVKALAQFERILISGNSRFDQASRNEIFLEDEEVNGQQLFFFELAQTANHPGCSHCHGGPLLTDNRFLNNGLDSVGNLNGFADKGRGIVTSRFGDNGKFRVPSLRNIELTAPYMHDGRFNTLEEVIEHYASGGHWAENIDANIRPFTLSEQEQQELLAFLRSFTDESFVNNPDFQNPFD